MSQIGLVLLAAGESSRMGSPKQLLDYHGAPLLRHASEEALKCNCGPVIVVLGSKAAKIREVLEGLPVDIVENAEWWTGIGSSIRIGVSRAEKLDLDGIILALADQPLVLHGTYNTLIMTWRVTKKPIVASQYAGTVGVPAFFSREYFCKLIALEPAQGCKGLILSNGNDTVRLDCAEAEADVDTPQDFERIQAL